MPKLKKHSAKSGSSLSRGNPTKTLASINNPSHRKPTKIVVDTAKIEEKLKKLEQVKVKLKNEFVGISHQIDQMVESIKVWYIFPETLNKPLIVNLWGITGTFKTSVIRRFVQLLDIKTFKEIDSRMLPTKPLKEIIGLGRHIDDPDLVLPEVFLLDEFQNIRTISNRGDDTESSSELYELFSWLSDGKIKYTRSSYMHSKLLNLVAAIENNRQLMIDDLAKASKKRNQLAIDNDYDESSISNLAEEMYNLYYYTFEEYFVFSRDNITKFKDNINGLFDFIINESSKLSLDYTLDLSKGLIFIAGNVDEAFAGLTHNMDNDMLTPDQFYEVSSQVNFNVIKESLLYRFKPEQVARLGTNHVIFPSFNTKMYTKFIQNLHKRTVNKFKRFGIKIEIDDTVTQYILRHTAIPSQGARSVLSAHEYLVDSNIPEALASSLLNKGKSVIIAIKDDNVLIITNKKIITKEITIIDKNVLENYPEPMNSIISTHESGHTLGVIALLGIYPDVVKVRSNDGGIGGYVKYNGESLPTREMMKMQLAITMSGYAAEYLVNGPDNVSAGSSSDILSATATASYMIKILGFGDGMSANGFSMGRDGLVLNDTERLDQQVDDLISEAFTLACVVLNFYKKEHKKLTEKLKKSIVLKREDLIELLNM